MEDNAFAHDSVLGISESGKAETFNLQVDGVHEYIANGVVVSNCDAVRYVLSYLYRQPTSLFRPEDRAASISSKIPVFVPQTRASKQ